MISIVPASSGRPTSANSAKPKPGRPLSSSASETRMFLGAPVSRMLAPAWAEKASGIKSSVGDCRSRIAASTTTGISAATAPPPLISAVRAPAAAMMITSRRFLLSPAFAIRICPAQAVTPVLSSAALTMNRLATNITARSPKPAIACSSVTTPSAQSDSAAPIATTTTGSRFQAKNAIVTATTRAVLSMAFTRARPGLCSGWPVGRA